MGKVDDLFMDANDPPEYIGVKMGFLDTHSTLIPFEMATVDEERKTIVLSTDKQTAKNGPSFDDDREITPEFRMRSTPTTASSVLPPSSRAAPTQPTLPSRAPRQRAALRRPVGRRTT